MKIQYVAFFSKKMKKKLKGSFNFLVTKMIFFFIISNKDEISVEATLLYNT